MHTFFFAYAAPPPFSSADYSKSSTFAVDGTLQPDTYTIVPTTWDAGEEAAYSLTVYSDVPLKGTDGPTLKVIPTTVASA